MNGSLTRYALRLCSTLVLCLAGTAYAAGAPETAMAPRSVTTPRQGPLAPAVIIAVDQRETNLLKTANLIIVSDGSPARRRRVAH